MIAAYVKPPPELIRKRRIARRGKKNFDRFNDLHWFGKGGFVSLCCIEYIEAVGYEEWRKSGYSWRLAHHLRRK